MNDQRRVRFSSLGLLARDDLPMAVDVWLEDAVNAPWASKDTMKISGILARYILDPQPSHLNLNTIEDLHHVPEDSTRRALGLLSLFGMISAFSTANGEVRAALRLTEPQMLRILETREKLAGIELDRLEAKKSAAAPEPDGNFATHTGPEPHWFPDMIEIPATCEPAGKAGARVAVAPSKRSTAQLLRARMAEVIAIDDGSAEVSPCNATQRRAS